MHHGLVTCPRWTSLRSVAELMARNRIHCVVVLDDAGADRDLFGIISDRDLAEAFAAGTIDDWDAGRLAASPLLTVRADDELGHAAQLLAEHGASHVIVLADDRSSPVGLVSTLDLAAAIAA
jgi:CBS domain-containing protein